MQRNKDGEPKLFKLFGRFSLLFLLFTSYAFSSSFEDFKRSQTESFAKYVDERDNEFKNYLDEQWKEFNAFKGTPLYESPKPKYINEAKVQHLKSVGPKVTLTLPKKQELITPLTDIASQKIATPIEVDVEFDFFGTTLGFNFDDKMKKAQFYPQNQKGVKNFFETMASSDYEYLLSDIKNVAKNMNLNDWGLYLLIEKMSNKIYKNRDNADLFHWFIFSKLGYDVKIGLSNRHIVLMHYSKKIIYAAPNYSFLNKKYYVLSESSKENIGPLYSYEKSYPNATKPLNLSIDSLPKFTEDVRKKKLVFKQSAQEYTLEYFYNQNLVDFMATYPQADYETFFNAPLSDETYNSLANGLKKYIDGKQASSAINFVLNFVQNAFTYQTDDAQFGKEKVMFAQETLYFDRSDCEDRAILFANLVKKIFKIGIIGVKYKNHMATALYIPMEGESVQVQGRRFIVADPTYVNANIGQSMPQFKSKKPSSFIFLKTN